LERDLDAPGREVEFLTTIWIEFDRLAQVVLPRVKGSPEHSMAVATRGNDAYT
jgi:hypothetical protein